MIDKQTKGLLIDGSTMGIQLVFTTVIGAGLGYWLDGVYGTKPWLLLSGFGLGLVAGFRDMYRMVKRLNEPGQDESQDDAQDESPGDYSDKDRDGYDD